MESHSQIQRYSHGGETPGLLGELSATGEDEALLSDLCTVTPTGGTVLCDSARPKPVSGSQELDESSKDSFSVRLRQQLRLGTWNVRSLYQLGKTQILINECNRNRMDILGLSEVRWTGK